MRSTLAQLVYFARMTSAMRPSYRAVLDALWERKPFGANQAMSLADVQEWCRLHGCVVSDRLIKAAVKELIEKYHIPIGASRQAPVGYFLIVSDEDAQKAVNHLEAEALSLLRRCRVLSPKSDYGRQLLGQLEVEFSAQAQ